MLGAGIPLADLLGTVPREGEASLVERLQKMVALCVNSTVRQVIGASEETLPRLRWIVTSFATTFL